MPKLAPAPKNPAGPTPLRRPGSIRRTSTISTAWPQGYGQPMLMTGQARDLLTPADGSAPRITATGEFEILANQRREILSVSVQPDHTEVSHLVARRWPKRCPMKRPRPRRYICCWTIIPAPAWLPAGCGRAGTPIG